MSTLTAKAPVVSAGRQARRADRFAARRVLWGLSSLPRIRHCGSSLCKRTGDGQNVAVKLSDGVAGISGTQTCASPWSCPVCAQKIAAVRAAEVQKAVALWQDRGGRVVFMTLTMRHRRGQRLADLWDALSHGWGKVTSGRGWVEDADNYGTVLPRVIKSGARAGEVVEEKRLPYVRVVEVTHGKKGWHVHIHTLLFVAGHVSGSDVDGKLEALEGSVFARWSAALVSKGLRAPARHVTNPETGEVRSVGVDVRLVRREDSRALGDYFSKSLYVGRVAAAGAGWEIAGGSGKTARSDNRTPFQILADVAACGDADDLALWWEFEGASKGRRQLTWSVGLRDLLGMQPEVSDQDAAEDDKGGAVVMTFNAAEWRLLRWQAERLLALVEDGADKPLIWRMLSRPLPVDFPDAG